MEILYKFQVARVEEIQSFKNEIIIAGITQACGLTKKPSQQLTKENLKPKYRKIKDPLKKRKRIR